MRYCLTFILLCAAWGALAQSAPSAQKEPKHIHFFKNRDYLSLTSVDPACVRVLDSTRFVATYRYSYQKENWNPLGWGNVEVILQIGDRWSVCLPELLQRIDRARRVGNLPYIPSCKSPRIGTVYEEMAGLRLWSEHRVPYSDRVVRYEESEEFPAWQLTGEQTEILGYVCRQATATFRGREWSVWFAPDIPTATNLWLFRGLPGLILRAETQQYRFECTALRAAREALLQPEIRGRKWSRDRWRRFERQYHDAPYRFFNNNGEHAFYDGRFKLTEENWKIEYNPIELE